MAKNKTDFLTIFIYVLFIAALLVNVALLGPLIIDGVCRNYAMVLSVLLVGGAVRLLDYWLDKTGRKKLTGFEEGQKK